MIDGERMARLLRAKKYLALDDDERPTLASEILLNFATLPLEEILSPGTLARLRAEGATDEQIRRVLLGEEE